jgi:hypothetical protein
LEKTSEPALDGLAVRRHPQDLAAERAVVLRQRAVAGVTGADVEVAVRAEGDRPPSWVGPFGMPVTTGSRSVGASSRKRTTRLSSCPV